MNYDLRNTDERNKFIRRANALLNKQSTNVSLSDESNRTLNQNSYIHILCRILAIQTGVTEAYAKQVYFKEIANADIFSTVTQDKITGKMVKYYKSTADLTINEMRKAITRFREWAQDNGYYLPEAQIADDGTYSFTSEKDRVSFHQAIIQTSKMEDYL